MLYEIHNPRGIHNSVILLHPLDNVAVALVPIAAGQQIEMDEMHTRRQNGYSGRTQDSGPRDFVRRACLPVWQRDRLRDKKYRTW